MPKVLQGATGEAVELLTYGEAAERLGVEAQTLRAYVHRRVLHTVRIAEDPGCPYLFAEEVAWYDRRRRSRTTDAGPNPYATRYAELSAAGAIAPLLVDPSTAQARILAQLDAVLDAASAPKAAHATRAPGTQGATPSTPAPALDVAAMLREGAGAGWLRVLGLLVFVLLALYVGRRPDAGKVEQLRATPGAGRLSDTLRQAAELLDTAA